MKGEVGDMCVCVAARVVFWGISIYSPLVINDQELCYCYCITDTASCLRHW